MIRYPSEINPASYWGVGRTTKASLEDVGDSGQSRRAAAQFLRSSHNAVLLCTGGKHDEVRILLTPAEARRMARDLIAKAKEIEATKNDHA